MVHCTIARSYLLTSHKPRLVWSVQPERPKSLKAHDFDKRRWFVRTWVRYLRMTLCADPPRAKVIVASARAVVFSVTMRNASDWALGPPAKSFIILKCIT
jgi:hypothetical protein